MSVGSSAITAAPQVSTPSVPRKAQVDLAGVSHSYPLSHNLEHGWFHLLLRRFSPTARVRYEAGAAKPDQLVVLHDIDLTVAPGEFISFMGPPGCGKSTVLRLLAGLGQPIESSVIVDSTQVTGPSPLRALAFQDAALLPWKAVQDSVALSPGARSRVEHDRRRVETALQFVRLRDFTDSYPSTLSGGMAQRVSLARALVNQPQPLLLGEPLGKLDALTHLQLQDEILRLWESQRFTAILVTHNVDEVLRLSNQVVVLSERSARVVTNIEMPEHDEPGDGVRKLHRRILGLLGR